MQFPAEDLRCLIAGGSWMAQFDQLPDQETPESAIQWA